MPQTAERHQTLWLLTASPTIWAAHFLLSYITASIWCAKQAGPDGSLTPVRIAIISYTIVALIGIVIIARVGYGKHTHGEPDSSNHADTPEDRHRFLGFATLLLSCLSAVAVLFAGLVTLFFGTCS